MIKVPIDQAFDVELAEKLARAESFNKHLYRPNSYLHKWWARRCGSTFRLILKHLVADPERRGYYTAGGLEGRVILDPMMGGGTTLHEAIRLGANVIGMDIDPIPVLQARATLSDVPIEVLDAAFGSLLKRLSERVGEFFGTECPVCRRASMVRFTLYGSKRQCACGSVLLVDSLTLRHESDGSRITLCPNCHEIGTDGKCSCAAGSSLPRILDKETVHPMRNHFKPGERLLDKGNSVCRDCNTPFREQNHLPFFSRYSPVAIVGTCEEHGLFFKRPGPRDAQCLGSADARRPQFSAPEDFLIVPGPKSRDLVRRGITSYLDLFSSRQLLYLQAACESLALLPPLVRLNLALLVSTSLEFNSMLCGYKGGDKRRPGAVRHTFSHHAYSFPYTALENNPLAGGRASGTLHHLFTSRIRRGRAWAAAPIERIVNAGKPRTISLHGEVDAGDEVLDARELKSGVRRFVLVQDSAAGVPLESGSVDYVVTDPPYFDSVQYSDLATFFRVWLRRLIPEGAAWDYDTTETAVESQDIGGNGRYVRLLSSIFAECRRVLKKSHGRMVFTFHHWSPRGWAALTVALRSAGFVLINHYVVQSENLTSVHITNLKALTHDAILVTAPSRGNLFRQWELPTTVDTTDSRRFCEACATSLGWMLEADLDDREISRLWTNLLAPVSR